MNSLKSPTFLGSMNYNIYINTKHVRGENMEDKELQKQIEQIVEIKIDDDIEKTVDEIVDGILELGGK